MQWNPPIEQPITWLFKLKFNQNQKKNGEKESEIFNLSSVLIRSFCVPIKYALSQRHSSKQNFNLLTVFNQTGLIISNISMGDFEWILI